MALLDLFSREKKCRVEELLGMNKCERRGRYSAALVDDNEWKFTNLADQYLIRGITDFKIKVNGKLEMDKERFAILDDLRKQHGAPEVRIRVDANNLWAGHPEEAIDYLRALDCPAFAIEEL